MAAARLKSQIQSAFKMHGLTLRSEGSRYLVEVFSRVGESVRDDALDRLIEAIQKQPLPSSMIDKAVCEAAVHECNAEDEEDSDKILSVIDTFSIPRLTYNIERKKFLPSSTLGVTAPVLYADANTKTNLFRDRYTVLYQRTTRHELFTPAAFGVQTTSKKFKLKPIEFLLGSSSKLGDIIVLGMLTQLKEGKWYLEDNTGAVQLDLSRANFHTGLFTENCFVLAEGWYEDEVFHVNAFGFPPPELAKTTRSYFGNINFFGGPSATCAKASVKMQQTEKENVDAMFVCLSDVWLDQVKVQEKLRTLFTGYSDAPPSAFIFCGNFTSMPYGSKHIRLLRVFNCEQSISQRDKLVFKVLLNVSLHSTHNESLRILATMLSEFPNLMEASRFIFVPGPKDPGPGHILPRPAIPTSLTEEFCSLIPSAVFTTNPCRIQYCTQEIVVYREDLVMKMCRNCVRFPSDGDIPNHFAKTLICQGHLSPLPLHVAPIYWAYDNALSLYPAPDLVICADKYDPFTSTQGETIFMNPGSFPRSDFSFKVYLPSSRKVEDSRIVD